MKKKRKIIKKSGKSLKAGEDKERKIEKWTEAHFERKWRERRKEGERLRD